MGGAEWGGGGGVCVCGGGGGGGVLGSGPPLHPPDPKMFLRLRLLLFLYLSFPPFLVCRLFLTTIMNKGNRGGSLK